MRVFHKHAPLIAPGIMRDHVAKNARRDESTHGRRRHYRDKTEAINDKRHDGDAVGRIDTARKSERAEKGKRQTCDGERMNADDDSDKHFKLRGRDVMRASRGMKRQSYDPAYRSKY